MGTVRTPRINEVNRNSQRKIKNISDFFHTHPPIKPCIDDQARQNALPPLAQPPSQFDPNSSNPRILSTQRIRQAGYQSALPTAPATPHIPPTSPRQCLAKARITWAAMFATPKALVLRMVTDL